MTAPNLNSTRSLSRAKLLHGIVRDIEKGELPREVYGFWPFSSLAAVSAFNGSLDAAKSIHESTPGDGWFFCIWGQVGDSAVTVSNSIFQKRRQHSGKNVNPARANALIAKESDDGGESCGGGLRESLTIGIRPSMFSMFSA